MEWRFSSKDVKNPRVPLVVQLAYDAHLPAFDRFRSEFDTVVPEKAVRSDEVDTGKIELTGECGKDRR
jgi:hypothetical protein